MGTAGDVRELLKERPDLEPAIEAVLKPDPPFSFVDVSLDSGAFGELVSRGIVEEIDDGYRVTDPEAVRRGLSGDGTDERSDRRASISVPSLPMEGLELVFLAGAIALVVAARLIPVSTVYHGGHVVLSSNDPYYYRYLVEQLLANPAMSPNDLGVRISKQEPLLVTTLWFIALTLGGTNAAAGHVLAWYPVASAVVTAALVYALAVVVTNDRRIGLAAVGMLAVIPAHAFRTSLGFADHHAFDYVWLAVTLLGIAVVAREARRDDGLVSRVTAVAIAAIAVGIAAQTLAWDNSPIILAAVAGYLSLEGFRSVSAGDDPRRTIAPVVIGVGAGAVLTWIAHGNLNWHTTLVASAPALLTIGGVGVLLGAELVQRIALPNSGLEGDFDPATVVLGALQLGGLMIGLQALRILRPSYWTRLSTGLSERLLAPRPIAEVQGLFSEAGGWLLLLGFTLFLGVPYLVWASAQVSTDGRWLPPVSYAWYFLILSAIQVRFVGELAPVLVVFAGLGLVHLAERIDVAKRPHPFTIGDPPKLTLPDRRRCISLSLLVLLVGSLGIVQVPVKTSQVTVPQAQSETAFWIAEYSNEHEINYPDSYVFSEWGWNRMFNYFVSGESESYRYAEANFGPFVTSTDPLSWYDRLGSFRRVGAFVVTTPDDIGEPGQLGTRLHRNNGAGSGNSEALAHYRLVHITGDGAYKVFTVVPGAIIRGSSSPNATVTARTEVSVDGIEFAYNRTATADSNGRYSLRVAQPGTYQVANETAHVNVTEIRRRLYVDVG